MNKNLSPESPVSDTSATTQSIADTEATTVIADDLIDIEQFMKVKLRVGEIIAAEPLPKSKKLLKLQVNLGEQLGTRQVLAGIAPHHSPESLVGKRIIVVANLKPAMLMGNESQGMLLAAANDDGSGLTLVDPGSTVKIGSEVR